MLGALRERIASGNLPLIIIVAAPAWILAPAGCSLSAGAASPETADVSAAEAEAWIHHAVPLPHQIEIAAKVSLSPEAIAVVGASSTDPAAEEAARTLRNACRAADSPERAAFTLRLQLGGAEAEPLAAHRHADQAYRILPENDGSGLRIVALSPRGLLYGARTLAQLVRARASGDRVEVPLLAVLDGPDLEDRGLWGADTHAELAWLAERKLNIVEQISALSVDRESRRGRAELKPERETMVRDGPRLGIEPVPAVLHLDQLEGKGVFETWPELRAVPGPGVVVGEGAICYSRPEIVSLLADWIAELARLPSVDEVDVWLAENLQGKGGCRCPECATEDRSVLEVRAVLAAWRKAGGASLRILTSEETYPSLERVFAEIPPEVKVWYYHSLLTYTVRKAPMIGGAVERAAGAGAWVGVVPILVGHVRCTSPFTGPQFLHARMTELVAKGIRGVLGYATPRVAFGRFNVEAMAEWSWNSGGRTPREFALSWAVREGMPDPEAFADWTEALGPVAWRVYGSEWPAGERRKFPGRVADLLLDRRIPDLGKGRGRTLLFPWGDICCDEELDGDVEAAARALEIARSFGDEASIQETLVVQGHVGALKALRELRRLVGPDGIDREKRDAARRWFEAYDAGLAQASAALPPWEAAAWEDAGPEAPGRGGFTAQTVELVEAMRARMRGAAERLGCASAE